MSRFYRIVCGMAAVLISLGLLLGLLGFLLGGRAADLGQVNFPLHGSWLVGFYSRGDRNNPLSGSDTIDIVYPGTEIRKLDFELSCANVTFREGDAFRVEAKKINAKRFRTELDGDTWEIECDVKDLDRISTRKAPAITITVPRGFVADDMELELAMGVLTMMDVTARESDIEVGMGELTASGFSSGDCKLTIGMGSLELSGEITGRSSIDCGMGSAVLTLAGSPEDYGFDTSVGMGSITVNGTEIAPEGLPPIGSESVGGLAAGRSWNTNAPNFFEVDCGMGSVEVSFRRK